MMATYREEARNMKNGIKKAYGDAKAQVKDSARRVKGEAVDEAEGLAGSVQHLAEEGGRLAREAYEYGRERVSAGAETAREAVQERPLAMLAAAFVGGAVLAALLKR